jgi:primosomal protein N'
MLRIETLSEVEKETIEEGSPFKWRSVSLAKDTLVDMKNVPSIKNNEKPRFQVLSPELKNLISQNTEENTHLFIFSLRRGLAPITACGDCGTSP